MAIHTTTEFISESLGNSPISIYKTTHTKSNLWSDEVSIEVFWHLHYEDDDGEEKKLTFSDINLLLHYVLTNYVTIDR